MVLYAMHTQGRVESWKWAACAAGSVQGAQRVVLSFLGSVGGPCCVGVLRAVIQNIAQCFLDILLSGVLLKKAEDPHDKQYLTWAYRQEKGIGILAPANTPLTTDLFVVVKRKSEREDTYRSWLRGCARDAGGRRDSDPGQR